MPIDFITFLKFMLSVLLSLDIIILDVITVDHNFKTARPNLDRLSENDAFAHSPQHVKLRKNSSTE